MGHPRFVVAPTKPLLLAGKGAPPARASRTATSNDCTLHFNGMHCSVGKRANCNLCLNLAAQERTSNRTRSFYPANIHDYSRCCLDRLSQCQQISSARTCAGRRGSVLGILSGSTVVGLVRPFDPKAVEQLAFPHTTDGLEPGISQSHSSRSLATHTMYQRAPGKRRVARPTASREHKPASNKNPEGAPS
jgi:hypothetical protein